MGFDCTLHVVDAASLARFSARLLGDARGEPADADLDARLAAARRLLDDDPEAGAREVAALALLVASRDAPHAKSRGFAISLWDEGVLGRRPPAKLLGSIAEHLPAIVAAHPSFARHAPRRFDGNFAVGPFVAAEHVPALLAHVERALEGLVPGDRAPYLPLVRVLRAAASRGLAYWEGTDLAVASAHDEWLTEDVPAGVRVAPSPIASPIARPLAARGTRLLVHETFRLHEVAFGSFPPRVSTREGVQVTAVALGEGGPGFARVATDPTVRPFVFAHVDLATSTPVTAAIPFEVAAARAVDGGVLLLPSPYADREHLAPHVLRGGSLARLDVPAPRGKPGSLEHAAEPFGDGSWLLVWDRIAYRWDGAASLTQLGATPLGRLEDALSAFTTNDGAIVGAFGRRLLRVDRAGKRRVLLGLDNVMHVARGPAGAIVVHEGDNPEGDALKILWPDGAVTGVPPRALGLAESPTLAIFDEGEGALVALARGAWHALGWDVVASSPRAAGDAFAAARARLAKRRRR